MQEHRKLARTRVLKSAKLLFQNSSGKDCLVQDLTNVGASIVFSDTVDLPATLDLTFDSGRSIRPCRLAWRTSDKIGVEFL